MSKTEIILLSKCRIQPQFLFLAWFLAPTLFNFYIRNENCIWIKKKYLLTGSEILFSFLAFSEAENSRYSLINVNTKRIHPIDLYRIK